MPDEDDSAHTMQPDSESDHHMETASHEMIHLENMDSNSTVHSGKFLSVTSHPKPNDICLKKFDCTYNRCLTMLFPPEIHTFKFRIVYQKHTGLMSSDMISQILFSDQGDNGR